MDLETFERRAGEVWASFPAQFKDGVTALVIEPGAWGWGEFDDDWCYGRCDPDEALAAIPGAPHGSIIRLFYGSFVHISRDDETFDWEYELWETIRHELQHHLGMRAGHDQLGDDEEAERDWERYLDGRDVPFAFHRRANPLDKGVWSTDHVLFLEVPLKKQAWFKLSESGAQTTWGPIRATVPPLDCNILHQDDVVYCGADVEIMEEEDASLPWDEVVLVLQRVRGWFG